MEHVITEESDHNAIIVRARETASVAFNNGPRRFCYEEMWVRHEGYEDMVRSAWEKAVSRGQGAVKTCDILNYVSAEMQKWGRTVFGSVRKQISKLKTQLGYAKERALVSGCSLEV